MDRITEKLNDFKAELREAILNERIPMKIEDAGCAGYVGEINISIGDTKDWENDITFAVGEKLNFISYERNCGLLRGMFTQEDMPQLRSIVEAQRQKMLQKRMVDLQKELIEVESQLKKVCE